MNPSCDSLKDTLRWADYLRRGCNENACYGLPIENRCDECLFYNAAADEMERLRAERDKIVKWLDRPRYFGDRYVREGYDTATDDVRRILDAE